MSMTEASDSEDDDSSGFGCSIETTWLDSFDNGADKSVSSYISERDGCPPPLDCVCDGAID